MSLGRLLVYGIYPIVVVLITFRLGEVLWFRFFH